MAVDNETVDRQLRALGEDVYAMYSKGKVLKYLPDILEPEETILALSAGTIAKRGWLFVVTGTRLLMLTKGIFTRFRYDQLPLELIDGVYHLPGLMFDKVQLISRGKSIVINVLVKDDAPKLTAVLADLLRRDAEPAEDDPLPDAEV